MITGLGEGLDAFIRLVAMATGVAAVVAVLVAGRSGLWLFAPTAVVLVGSAVHRWQPYPAAQERWIRARAEWMRRRAAAQQPWYALNAQMMLPSVRWEQEEMRKLAERTKTKTRAKT